MTREEEIAQVVDEFVDDLNVSSVESEASRLGMSTQELINEIAEEAKRRVVS
jgi:hypothetical protein